MITNEALNEALVERIADEGDSTTVHTDNILDEPAMAAKPKITKKKAILYDGPNAHMMTIDMGIAEVSFKEITSLLKNDIGGDYPIGSMFPAAVVSPNFPESLRKAWRNLGWDLIEAEPSTEEDDKQLIRLINQIDADHFASIVLVSCDQDYADILDQKSREGIEIYVVYASSPRQSNGRTSISQEYQATYTNFNFVDLVPYKDRIARRLFNNTESHERSDNKRNSRDHRFTVPQHRYQDRADSNENNSKNHHHSQEQEQAIEFDLGLRFSIRPEDQESLL